MPKIFLKNILLEIKTSLGRFLSILCIVCIGVSFFAGIKASAPDMKYSADTYFDDQNYQDIQVYSTLGLDENDLEAIQALDGVQEAQGSFSMDVLTYLGTNQLVLKLFSLNPNNSVNTIRLVEGRMPEKENECLIEAPQATSTLFGSLEVGDTITIESGTDEDLSETLTTVTYTIVGTCYTPTYLSYEKGSSSIGSGSIDSLIFVPEDNIKVDYYTEIDVLVEGAKDLNSYDEEYFAKTDPVKEKIEDIAGTQIQQRLDDYYQEIEDSQDQLDQEINEASQKINDGYTKLQEAENEIEANAATLASSRNQLDQAWSEYYSNVSILDSIPTLENAIQEIESQETNLPVYQQQQKELEENLATVNQSLDTIEWIKQIPQEQWTPEQAYLVGMEQELLSNQNDLILGLEQIKTGISQIEQAIAQKQGLQSNLESLYTAQNELQNAYNTLLQNEQAYSDGLNQIASAKQEVASSLEDLQEAQEELDKQKQEAQIEIDDAKEDIDSLDAQWMVLDRDSNYSYRDYGACADRMDGIASVFPVFFFLVAALVCMTTMSRMVDEQRTEIGTLKALGYSKAAIVGKYIIYAFSASLIGSIVGCIFGMLLFPYVIFSAWNTLYNLPQIHYELQLPLAFLASGSVIGVTLLATFLTIYQELNEVPSQLMRPKAVRAGKKIMLERIKPIWSRLTFLHKVTARNLFRYKKRFFMTVLGIAGCSALMVAGFGINDSISTIASKQYEDIYHYNATINVDEPSQEIIDSIQSLNGIEEAFYEEQLNSSVYYEEEDHSVVTHIIKDKDTFEDFTTLMNINSKNPLHLNDTGVLVSQKLADQLGIQTGDTIELEYGDNERCTIIVNGIFENYVGHHIYMTENYYTSLGIKEGLNSICMIKTDDQSSSYEEELGKKLMNIEGVSSVSFYSSLQQNFIDMISSISYVVVVLIISAAALAFVVLYNLSNVNISERVREIATIKVLGFTKKEVNQYVNREGILLAVIGALVGLGVGIFLHRLIMSLAEMDDVMFGRTIQPISFLYSFGLTMVFTFIINFFMSFKLNRIQMVESLKAIE